METPRPHSQEEPLKNNDRPLEEGARQEASTPHRGSTGLADRIDNIITSPTNAVRSRTTHHDSLRETGTNVSYEGQTAPGGGGSAGTGEASGQSATGSRITGSDSDDAIGNNRHEEQGDRQGTNNPYNDKRDASEETDGSGNPLQRDHDDALDRNTLGTP